MFHVKLMKNQMPVLIGQKHGDFKVTAQNFGQVYIVGYTVANFWSYPIRSRVTKPSALEYLKVCMQQVKSLYFTESK